MKYFLPSALVAAWPLFGQLVFNNAPTREFGQPSLVLPSPVSNAPNLVEGREFNGPSGIAFDYSTNPPAVYVSDTGNNRVLGWRNSAALATGAPADIVIGQPSLVSTLPAGPGTSFSTGLNLPRGITVDSQGNLYVVDAGNNRVLRYVTPLKQPSGQLLPVDLVIGQKSINSGNQPNEGNPYAPGNKTLAFVSGNYAYPAGLALDAPGNLWVSDPVNNRVLRFPSANLTPNLTEPAADLVLGQCDFASYQAPQYPNNTQTNLAALVQPSGVAFDSSGRLYISDNYARVLEFSPPSTNCQSADRVLGIRTIVAQGQQPQAYPTNYTLGLLNQSGAIAGAPQGVFTMGPYVFVCDTPAHRIVSYDSYSNWAPQTQSNPSPPQKSVFGQPDLFSGQANRNLLQPSNASLSFPTAGAANTATNELWIVDSGNNRVLIVPQQASQYIGASRVLGQMDFASNSPNLIEGREVYFYNPGVIGVVLGAGVAVDKNSNPPHLYVADPGNNRVLGFLDARKVGADAHSLLTQKADLVIGQPDLAHALPNYSPSNLQPSDAQTPNNTGLIAPVGLAVDANGNLFVADSGNGRVMRFPAPFAQPPGLPKANLVLGQSGFSSKIQDPSSSTMSAPFGLALFSDGSLAVSDAVHNRVLVFQKPAGGDFATGQAAALVLGQPNFTSIAAPSPPTGASLSGPRHLATDSSDRLYICDTGNGRILVFANALKSISGATAALVVGGLNQPEGVAVSPSTGEIWVANTGSNQLLRYPEFNTLQITNQPTETLSAPGPLAAALDAYDNLVVAEAYNRVSFYFPLMFYRHAATYAAGTPGTCATSVNLTPGMLALLGRYGTDFSLTAASTQSPPWPTSGLNDVEVLVGGIPAPIFRLDPNVIYFQVPYEAPSSGTADVIVLHPSTGQILAAANFGMQPAAPGIFTANAQGTGPAAATNSDGTPNSSGHGAARGDYITLWLTGAGFIPNVGDGVAPGAAISTPTPPQVFIGLLPATNIQYSGVSPQYPGLWQINVQVPQNVPPGTASVLVNMSAYDLASNCGGTSAVGGPGPDQALTPQNNLIPTIVVK
ncbi:MAG TPA: hypothetical protein VKV74_10635 [Bryobacteraceae bacterium]|nr:hypothetical protein [Bryobacteraceae bacterium]